jgi:hypothetical protein
MAKLSFLQAVELDTSYNRASQRLYMMQRTSTVCGSNEDDAEIKGFATYQEIRKILLSGILSVR